MSAHVNSGRVRVKIVYCACLLVFASTATASLGESVSPQQAASTEAEQITVAGLTWHTDYHTAYREAKQQKQMLLINFVTDRHPGAQQDMERSIESDPGLTEKLNGLVRARLHVNTDVEVDAKPRRLIEDRSFAYLEGQPGIAVIDLKNEGTGHYGHVVSAYPFRSGKYYRWQTEYLPIVLDLPPGTITQRTMIWAVRVHPEQPASTTGSHDTRLAGAATQHSLHQANIGVQGHHQWETRFHQIRGDVQASTAVEVVAESWPNQNMLDSCLDCVASWRHSSGHWGAVRRRHRKYGYDIRRGRNGIWYGTGIFAN